MRDSHTSAVMLAGSGLVSRFIISSASCIVRRASNVWDQCVQLAPLSFGRAIPDGSEKVVREELLILEMARGPALAAARAAAAAAAAAAEAAGVAGAADICYEIICRRGASVTGLNKDRMRKGSLL
jgi:hypothetical protein